ncbi:MAG: hypothetical protein AB1551_06680 [Actinomycetota bacterium]
MYLMEVRVVADGDEARVLLQRLLAAVLAQVAPGAIVRCSAPCEMGAKPSEVRLAAEFINAFHVGDSKAMARLIAGGIPELYEGALAMAKGAYLLLHPHLKDESMRRLLDGVVA